jgi:hypothetical protein
MKKVAIVAIFSIFFVVFPSTNSLALDKCFSELSDSEWNFGQPTIVTNSLNYDLVGTKTTSPDMLTVSNNWNLPMGLFFEKIDFETTYRYIGKSCTERIIKIPGSFIDFQTTPISDLENQIKSSASNFEVGEKNLATFKSIASTLKQVKGNASINSNGLIKGKWLDWSMGNESFEKFQQSFGPGRSSFLDQLEFKGIFYRIQNKCGEFSYIAELNTDKSPAMVGTPQIISSKWGAMFIAFNSSKTCLIDTYIVFGAGNSQKIYNLATFSLKPIGKFKNTSILCKNGSSTKKLTGLRPKCPIGFTKK